MYIRMTFRPVEAFELLEPLLKDYRKLRVRSMGQSSIFFFFIARTDGQIGPRSYFPRPYPPMSLFP